MDLHGVKSFVRNVRLGGDDQPGRGELVSVGLPRRFPHDLSQHLSFVRCALLSLVNHRKLAILRFLAHVPDASATEIAEALGLTLPAAGMALLRLNRNGLVARALD